MYVLKHALVVGWIGTHITALMDVVLSSAATLMGSVKHNCARSSRVRR